MCINPGVWDGESVSQSGFCVCWERDSDPGLIGSCTALQGKLFSCDFQESEVLACLTWQ